MSAAQLCSVRGNPGRYIHSFREVSMTLNAQFTHPSSGPDAKRNFILQQGLCEPEAGTCPLRYSALLFQPWLVGSWVVVAAVLQAPLLFFALAAVLWWSALAPR